LFDNLPEMMEKTAFCYAMLRYPPRLEAGEFANVGVVLMSPKTRHFSFRLLEQPTERILMFFSIKNANGLAAGLDNFRYELVRVKAHAENLETSQMNAMFEELTRPREAIFRFGPSGALLAAEPQAALDDLYYRYIEPQSEGFLAP
jgi:Protein of unknown function (DUF3037)